MKIRQLLTMGMIAALTAGMATATMAAGAQATASVRGTAKNEAKKPYTDYSVRARNVQQGQIGGMSSSPCPNTWSKPEFSQEPCRGTCCPRRRSWHA